jgi:hypothetical protein
MKNAYVWDSGKSRVVNISKIRNFSIEAAPETKNFKLMGWFSDNETVCIRFFPDIDSCEKFLKLLLAEDPA